MLNVTFLWVFGSLVLSPVLSRVHITEATLNHLGKTYEVEEGNGHLRDPYLESMNIKTYLVVDPRVCVCFLNIYICPSIYTHYKNIGFCGTYSFSFRNRIKVWCESPEQLGFGSSDLKGYPAFLWHAYYIEGSKCYAETSYVTHLE